MAGFTISEQDDSPSRPMEPVADGDLPTAAETAPPVDTPTTNAPAVSGQDAAPRHTGGRMLSSSGGGPLALPRRVWTEDEDVDMTDVSGDDSSGAHDKVKEHDVMPDNRVQTVPTLPSPPVFRGSTSREKQIFMKAYEAYCRQLSALETAFFRPFRMPVGACVEDEHRRLIAMFDICKPLDSITERDWIDYFWEGRISGELDFDKVKSIVSTKLKMDTQLADANSRVSKLAHDMYQILEKESMEWMIEGEPKKVVNYMINALGPEQFQRTVRNEMSRESNKPLLKNVVGFTNWLRASCKEYLRWEPASVKRSQASTNQKSNNSKKSDSGGSTQNQHSNATATTSRPKRTCLKCGSDEHRVKECPQAQTGEAETLLREWREKRAGKISPQQQTKPAVQTHSIKILQLVEVPLEVGGSCAARVENGVDLPDVLLDSGADVNVVSRGLIKQLRNQGIAVNEESCEPHRLSTFDGSVFEVTKMVRLDTIQIQTTAGPLLLRRTPAWVFEQETEKSTLILSRPVMERLGYSVDAILARACDTQGEWDLQDLAVADISTTDRIRLLRDDALEGMDPELRAATPELAPPNAEMMVAEILADRVSEAAAAGLGPNKITRLEAILLEYRDVFRIAFGDDPPIRVEPLRVRLRDGATPELLDHELVFINPSSRWASPPRIVAKSEPGTYRMTVDTRAVNARTDPIQWPMPILEAALTLLEGSSCYFTLDWFRGYWQLPPHKDSREMFSIMTHRGIITPTRVLMGGMDAVAYCQHAVEEVFRSILYHGILAWLDDILGYASDPVDLLEILERVLAACRSFGLNLHPGKCRFFLREAQWCGKLVSGQGVQHSPSRIQGLVAMPDPTDVGQLQQFMCAVNWMRQSIARYSELAAPLLKIVDDAAKRVGGRKTKQLGRVQLSEIGWNQEHVTALSTIKEALVSMVPLAHPDPSKAVSLFTDASHDFWAAVCTVVDERDLEKPLEQQNHRPLAFLSGRFTGAQLRWPTIEKEAFAIVESAKRLEYLLLRPGGFHLLTDHRNLVYMFSPTAIDGAMQRYQADKLQRWAMTMTSYRYVIEHVRGSDNVWADMLSRWGNTEHCASAAVAAVKQVVVVPPPISPMAILTFQHLRKYEMRKTIKRATGYRFVERRTILFSRRQGPRHSGHRGERTTAAAVGSWCWWPDLAKDVAQFVRSCIHCVATRDGRVPRPYGPALHATKPNEVLHFDYLTLPEDEDTHNKYVLVLKDNLSGYVELFPTAGPDAASCAVSLLSWFHRYGIVKRWVSDQGTHFKNEVTAHLAKGIGANHHFTTAYCPWANGTAEVVNRMLLKCMRAVLSERKMPPSKWEPILGMVQAALNHQPSDRLGGRAPITAFTGLPAMTPLAAIFSDDEVAEMDASALWTKQQQILADAAEALTNMHRDVAQTSDQRRTQARARRAARAKPPNFTVGDFVLTATVIPVPNKLQGPKRVLRAVTDWIFVVAELNPPFKESTHHVSRMRLYAESSRELTEDLLNYALHSQGIASKNFEVFASTPPPISGKLKLNGSGLMISRIPWKRIRHYKLMCPCS